MLSYTYVSAFEVCTSIQDAELAWDTLDVTYTINESGGPAGSIPQILASMQTWTNVYTADFNFVYGGTTAKTAADYGSNDGENIVVFETFGRNGTLAQNTYWYYSSSGEIIDSDIRYNTSYAWSIDGSPGAYDIQNVGTHEFGHSLCLKDLYDPADSEKTMYGYSSQGETEGRSLDQDDIDGISYLYPCIFGVCPDACDWNVVDSENANACVSTAGMLQNCLAESRSDGKHNTIMVVQGTYTGNFTYFGTEDFDLLLYGGYDAGCGSNVYNPELTVLDGDTNGDTNGDGLTLALSTTGTGGLHVEGFRLINGANSRGYGGCIQVYTDQGNVEITGNLLNNCDADMGGGLAVDTISGSSWLINNIVYGNTADIGGGLAIWTTTGAITVLNNTFADNSATDKGGGIAVLLDNDAGSADVTNNIIWENNAGTCGSDVYLDSDYDGSSTYGTVVLEYNDFDTASGICVTDPLFSINATNINASPDFVDSASGDYHISEISPCIDEGDQTHPDLPALDIDGNNRVLNVSVDIGANEIVIPELPEAPVLLSPSGEIGTGTGECYVTPGVSLANGNVNWYVKAWNIAGTGPSSMLSFAVVTVTIPGAPTLLLPTGTVATDMPEYRWNAIAEADKYRLKVYDTTGKKVDAWYTAATLNCGSGTGECYVTPGVSLANGNVNWHG
jgi:hypothetical protein